MSKKYDAPNLLKTEVTELLYQITKELNDRVFNPLFNFLRAHPQRRATLNAAFPFPREVRVGILSNHFVVEYVGPNDDSTNEFESYGIYQPSWDIYRFLDIDLQHLKAPVFSVGTDLNNFNIFLGESMDHLTDYFYDFTQIPANMVLNGQPDFESIDQPRIITNCGFFYSDNNGALKVRHINVMEIFPFGAEGILYHDQESYKNLVEYIINSPQPKYSVELHGVLNDFIGLIADEQTTEPTITNFLERNPALLQLAFGYNALNPQIDLLWQYNPDNRPDLKPDFLPTRMDGYIDILEFKLPRLRNAPSVGKTGRREPSHEIDKAVGQIQEYAEWFEQQINRDWLESNLTLKSLHPQHYLVIGHSNEFSAADRQLFQKKRGVTMYTYDEFIELARHQLYRIH